MIRRLLVLLLLCAGVSMLPALVVAHGGGEPQLTNEPVGPYLLSAWTNPDPPQIGELHVTLGLAQASTGDALTDPTIVVRAIPANGDGTPQVVPASHEGALTPYFYEADLDFPTAGIWQIHVDVEGAEGIGSASFSLDVQESTTNWLLLGILAVVLIVVGWVVWVLFRKDN